MCASVWQVDKVADCMGAIVITTIQAPTAAVRQVVKRGIQDGHRTIVVGDRKTPDCAWPDGVDYLGIQSQLDSGLSLAPLLPANHYARKNVGYLLAIHRNDSVIYDTDDDNAPLATWHTRQLRTFAKPCEQSGWVNAYRWFSDAHIWPRGLPLGNASRNFAPAPLGSTVECEAPIQQGLANGSPDVDAVWRLLMDEEITFQPAESVRLAEGVWCPFNSQSTWWFPSAYPLLYLPSFVSFRMTDIWRSFVAQRCLWALGYGLVFHGAEVFQDRNPHNLLRDFEQEVPGYLGNDRIREVLEELPLSAAIDQVAANLHRCYEALVSATLVPAREIPLLEAWLSDIAAIR